ncbi:MAG: long-chain fatty acid--CoA ligase [Bacteroidia bacterium]|nr:long-chain fatty acid--CoA ligase [Bacteroidia bacterium]
MHKKIVPSPLTLKSLIDYSVSQFADCTSVSFVDGKPITYKELGEKIDEFAALLFSFGLKKGDKVALFSHNMPNWVIAYFSVVSRGLIIVPVLPDFTTEEVENVLTHSESKVLIVSERLFPKVSQIETPDLIVKIKLDDFSFLSDISKLTFDSNKITETDVTEDDVAAIIYTSGTTGRSKGVVLKHKSVTFVAMQSYTVQPINHNDVFLSFLPLSHTYENSIGMLYPIMYGATIYFLEKLPTAPVLIAAMEKIKPTMMLSVPLIMEKLYKNQIYLKFRTSMLKKLVYRTPVTRKIIHHIAGKKLYKTFGGRLKFFGIGGAKLDYYVERFLKEAKFPYAIGYGLTETAPLLAGAAPHQTKLQSTGYALEGVELRINEPDELGVGEIWAKGPNVMLEYYKNPEATAEVLTTDKWFRTGDLGQFDKKKRLFIKGRLKNTIIGASGENIYPEDIESIINNTAYVSESLVVEEDGFLVAKILLDLEMAEKNIEHIKLIIEEKKEHYHDWKNQLKKDINSKLGRSSQINRVDIMEEPFEKTASQKIKRFKYQKTKSKHDKK